MESSSASSASLSWRDCLSFFLLRPIFAVFFVVSMLSLGWFLAWKLILVHVPLVQEIFGLRKKEKKPRPPNRRRFTELYKAIDAQNRTSSW